MTVKPTVKQRMAAKALVDNGGNLKKAMLAAGYSPNTAKTPQKLTESEGWKDLVSQYRKEYIIAGISAEYMVKKTKEWLEAEKPFSSHTEPDRLVPDYQTQIKAAQFVREDFGLTQQQPVQVNTGDMILQFT